MLTSEQIEARAKAIGGSDAPIVCGLSGRLSAHELYLIKRGELDQDEPDEVTTWLGHETEDVNARWYMRETGEKLERRHKTYRHREIAHMIGHIDRKVVGKRKGVELKWRAHWKDWGPSGSDDIPDDVMLQVQHYLAVTQWDEWDVQVCIGGIDFRRYTILPDQTLIDVIIEREAEFWRRVEVGDPPAVDHEHPTTPKMLRDFHSWVDDGRHMQMPESDQVWHERYQEALRQIKDHAKVRDIALSHLLETMGTREAMWVDEGHYYQRKTIRRLDGGEYESFRLKKGARLI